MEWLNGSLSGKEEALADLIPRARVAQELTPIKEIDGDCVVDNWFVAAREIVFKKDARLIFSAKAQSRRSELFIVAKKITIEEGVAIVTAQRFEPPQQTDRGQATNGAPGAAEGANGGAGTSGSQGVDGMPGQNAPDVTVFLTTLGGAGNLEVDVSGGRGGDGGVGQRGGDGGAGARGSSARQARGKTPFGITIWLPACEAGPGRGGDGGLGGGGGRGGTGGVGGRGGNITICSDPAVAQVLTQAINCRTNGGAGGEGGAGGKGGGGGIGGSVGQLASFCNDPGDRNGNPGPSGADGVAGGSGVSGEAGALFVVSVSEKQSNSWFGS